MEFVSLVDVDTSTFAVEVELLSAFDVLSSFILLLLFVVVVDGGGINVFNGQCSLDRLK